MYRELPEGNALDSRVRIPSRPTYLDGESPIQSPRPSHRSRACSHGGLVVCTSCYSVAPTLMLFELSEVPVPAFPICRRNNSQFSSNNSATKSAHWFGRATPEKKWILGNGARYTSFNYSSLKPLSWIIVGMWRVAWHPSDAHFEKRLGPFLPTLDIRIRGQTMLEKNQLRVGLQDSANPANSFFDIRNSAHHERAHNGIDLASFSGIRFPGRSTNSTFSRVLRHSSWARGTIPGFGSSA